MEGHIQEFRRNLDMYRDSVSELVTTLRNVSSVWTDEKYSDISNDIQGLTSSITSTMEQGISINSSLIDFQRTSEEEF